MILANAFQYVASYTKSYQERTSYCYLCVTREHVLQYNWRLRVGATLRPTLWMWGVSNEVGRWLLCVDYGSCYESCPGSCS